MTATAQNMLLNSCALHITPIFLDFSLNAKIASTATCLKSPHSKTDQDQAMFAKSRQSQTARADSSMLRETRLTYASGAQSFKTVHRAEAGTGGSYALPLHAANAVQNHAN
eukprot:gnl/MRDRNA2_/MRDRNA2_85733_c0_seq1.p2 gnl/MRDRNA2_/MRDRNA2_85733_c0~~gnl/MRDRNA2_/MRDRNA2_85733_c0_seq1.p2  ORF type:complete len:111 (+),score=6.90 gnl/MRDRNA2_/MRDRNA2_85733_c0_seq1:54-386(+)